jgi:hypothetical protein
MHACEEWFGHIVCLSFVLSCDFFSVNCIVDVERWGLMLYMLSSRSSDYAESLFWVHGVTAVGHMLCRGGSSEAGGRVVSG